MIINDNQEICEPLKIRRLDIDDKISNFNCGDEDLNDFILNESQLYRGELLAVSYVIEDNNGAVLAYFSLANDKISITEFENNTERIVFSWLSIAKDLHRFWA